MATVSLDPPGRYVPWEPHAEPSHMSGNTEVGSINEIPSMGFLVSPLSTTPCFEVGVVAGSVVKLEVDVATFMLSYTVVVGVGLTADKELGVLGVVFKKFLTYPLTANPTTKRMIKNTRFFKNPPKENDFFFGCSGGSGMGVISGVS